MAAQKKNDELKARNAKLDSEVQDLKQGTGAVEERARFELGMIKDNEIFVQVLDPNAKAHASAAAAAPAVTASIAAASKTSAKTAVANRPPPSPPAKP